MGESSEPSFFWAAYLNSIFEKLSEIEDAPPEKESGKFWDTIRRALGHSE